MKHEPYELKQMQSLPLEIKVKMTQRRVREWYEHWEGRVYVSFSGGKDSTVLKHIVDNMYDDVPAVFINAGLEYPEIQKFVREIKDGKYGCFNSDVEIVRPEMRFDEVIKRYGFPVISKEVAQVVREAKIGISRNDGSYQFRIERITGTGHYAPRDGKKSRYDVSKYKYLLDAPFAVSEKCCDIMKKRPARNYEKKTGRKVILGIMAAESMIRNQRWLKYGCNSFDDKNHPSSNPLSFWTEQDVLYYITKYNVPYASVYGKIVEDGEIEGQICIEGCCGKLKTTGLSRTGCMFCMFGVHLEKEPNRFQKMKKTHPKQYKYCMEQLGLKEVLEYIEVPYE